MKLVDYGIETEESDMRAHVSVTHQTVYLFPTYCGLQAIENHPEITPKPAYQPGVIGATANGYAMPIRYIPQMKPIPIPPDIFERANFPSDRKCISTSERGRKAEFIVKEMIKRGLIPVTLVPEEVKDKKAQIKGSDFVITTKECKVQVKCDWQAGPNVYLQIAERNPSGKH